MVEPKTYNAHIVNAKAIILESKIPTKKEYLDKYHLQSVEFNSGNTLSLGDKIDVVFNIPGNTYNTYYHANFMYKQDTYSIKVNEFEETISTTYLLPLIGLKQEHLLVNKNLINCYVNHYDFSHSIGEYLYLIYRYMPINYYAKFIEVLQRQEGFTYYQKDRDKRFDCFIFKVNPQFIPDIKLILDGEYSKINPDTKKIILDFHNQQNPEAPLNQILNKGILRKNELEEALGCKLPNDIDYAEKPKLIEETWNYKKN